MIMVWSNQQESWSYDILGYSYKGKLHVTNIEDYGLWRVGGGMGPIFNHPYNLLRLIAYEYQLLLEFSLSCHSNVVTCNL